MKEIVDIIIEIVSTLGIPVAMCIGMAVFIAYSVKSRKEEIERMDKERNEQYQKQRDDFSEMLLKVEENHNKSFVALKESLDSNSELVRTLITLIKGG